MHVQCVKLFIEYLVVPIDLCIEISGHGYFIALEQPLNLDTRLRLLLCNHLDFFCEFKDVLVEFFIFSRYSETYEVELGVKIIDLGL